MRRVRCSNALGLSVSPVLADSTNLACNGSSQATEQTVLCSPKLPTVVKLDHKPQVEEEDKENMSRTPTKPMEIAPSISNIEKCSAIQMATAAVLKIESASSHESTTIATCVTTTTTTVTTNSSATPENTGNQSGGGKSNPLLRMRTNSNASSADK